MSMHRLAVQVSVAGSHATVNTVVIVVKEAPTVIVYGIAKLFARPELPILVQPVNPAKRFL